MNNQKKKILIAAIALAVLIVLTVVAAIVLPKLSENESASSETEETVSVFSFDPALVDRIEVTNPTAGEDYAIVKGRKSGTTVYGIEGDDVFPYRQTFFTLNLDMLANLSAGKVVEQKATDLKKYGIGPESSHLTATLGDGSKVSLTFGSKYPLDSLYYYAIANEENTVYTIRDSIYTSLCGPYTDYRDIYLVPSLTDGSYDNLDTLTITRVDGYRLTVKRNGTIFRVTEPLEGEADSYNVGDKFFDKLNSFSPLAVIEDYPTDLGQYGLDKPDRVYYKLTDGTETTILIGYATDEYVFLMKEGIPMVFAATADLTFLDVQAEDLLDTGIFMYSIKNVLKVTYYEGETARVLEVDDRTNDEGEGTFKATYQGKPISEGNARSLYTGFLSFYSIASYTGAVPSETQYKVVFEMRDGTTNTMELRRLNTRQFAAVINGECHSYVSVTAINNLRSLIEKYEAGEDISDIFY